MSDDVRNAETGVAQTEKTLKPGMPPEELLFVDEQSNHACSVCGQEFDTWQGCDDHQDEFHGGGGHVEMDYETGERWFDDDEEFDWWITGAKYDTRRVTLELGEAANASSEGGEIHLAEPPRGGPKPPKGVDA